ncbi:YrhB domain-containing protein [Streptomyces sp. NPDC000229]|uniref:YrhB domain-containing protein n=1 Tax=Streptomyces sp. NPDC000229 TaxID=3154247 RepID=UPI00332B0982
MIDRDDAVRIVEEELERDYQERLSAGRDPRHMAVVRARRHDLVWIVSWTSEEYLRTANRAFALAGNGPYLVDRIDGSLHQIGVVSAMEGTWEADYRVRIRGQVVRTAVDDLHDKVRAVAGTRGRLHALHTLRRSVPALSLAQVIEYVTALHDGAVPEHLVKVSAATLIPPANPVPTTVTTIRRARLHRARRLEQ